MPHSFAKDSSIKASDCEFPNSFGPLLFLIWAGTVVRCLLITLPFERTYDAVEHVNYLLLLQNKWFVFSSECFQCYHPPLYYWLCKGFLFFQFQPDSVMHLKPIQALSAAYYAAFVYFGNKSLTATVSPQWLFEARLIFLAVPMGFVHAIRIGNDSLYYALAAIVTYHLYKWSFRPCGPRQILAATFFAGVAVLVKGNAIIFFSVIGTLLAIHSFKCCTRYLLPCALVFSASVGTYVSLSLLKGGALTNSAGLGVGMRVSNAVKHFTLIDITALLSYPTQNEQILIRWKENFWTHLISTAVGGEFFFSSILASFLIPIMLAIVLIWLVIITFGLLSLLKNEPDLVSTTLFVASIAALVAHRLMLPFWCSGDFRYIWPVIIPLTVLLMRGTECLTTKYKAVTCGVRATFYIFSICGFITVWSL